MSKKSGEKSKRGKKTRLKEEPIFIGVILGVFDDDGPRARYNQSKISKKAIEKMIIHGMSAVSGGEGETSGLFGPIPVYSISDLRTLLYLFKARASNTKDERILKYGRVFTLFLLFKEQQLRYVLNNLGSIEKMLADYIEKHWQKEIGVSKASVLTIFEEINSTIKVIGLRVFSFGKAGLMEYENPQMALDEGIISIIDEKKQRVFIYLSSEQNSKDRIKAVAKMEELNSREYSSKLKITKIRDYLKFKEILNKYSIQLVK